MARNLSGGINNKIYELELKLRNLSTGTGTTGRIIGTFSQPTTIQPTKTSEDKIDLKLDTFTWQLGINKEELGKGGFYINNNLLNINNTKFFISPTGDIGVGLGISDPTEKMDIGGNLRVRGYVKTDDLEVSNVLILNSSVINGNQTITSNLYVSGITTLENILQVNSSQNITEYLSIGSNLFVRGNLIVTGLTNLNNNLTVSGLTNLNNNLTVSGLTNLNNNLTVSGLTNLNNNLTVSGLTNLNNNLTISGLTNLNNNLIVSGLTNLNNTILNDNLTANSNVNILQNLNVEGDSYLKNLTVETINISQFSLFEDGLTIGTFLTVDGVANISSSLTVSGTSTFDMPVNINSCLYVSCCATINNLMVNNDLYVTGRTTIKDKTYLLSCLQVSGCGRIMSDLHVVGRVIARDLDLISDKNLKNNIKTLENALDKVNKLRGVEFNWKDTGNKEIGLIAQEVEQIVPELVIESDGTKSVRYPNLVALLIEAIKELGNKKQINSEYNGLLVSKNNNNFELSIDHPIGVISDQKEELTGYLNNSQIFVKTNGITNIWVININGNLNKGDLITFSNIPGCAIKQDDNIVKNITIGKVMENVYFDNIQKKLVLCKLF
jgi:acyl-[acyl carrier protein]--UDP-N-acetylglucosamine O-acyltransferase